VRSRPDVLLRTSAKDGQSAKDTLTVPMSGGDSFESMLAFLAAKEAASSSSAAAGSSDNARPRAILGYRGPWMGGWSDIAWAARFHVVSTLVAHPLFHTSLLAPLFHTSHSHALVHTPSRR
jgi:hypothetical protein